MLVTGLHRDLHQNGLPKFQFGLGTEQVTKLQKYSHVKHTNLTHVTQIFCVCGVIWSRFGDGVVKNVTRLAFQTWQCQEITIKPTSNSVQTTNLSYKNVSIHSLRTAHHLPTSISTPKRPAWHFCLIRNWWSYETPDISTCKEQQLDTLLPIVGVCWVIWSPITDGVVKSATRFMLQMFKCRKTSIKFVLHRIEMLSSKESRFLKQLGFLM